MYLAFTSNAICLLIPSFFPQAVFYRPKPRRHIFQILILQDSENTTSEIKKTTQIHSISSLIVRPFIFNPSLATFSPPPLHA